MWIYIVIEYVQGEPLSSLVRRKGLELTEALNYAVQMADALATAHAAGIIHRDLQTDNLIVSASGGIKLLDFGLAKLIEAPDPADSQATRALVTQEGAVLGTVAYMSPEQAQGRAVDTRSDIFSFGVMLYEMTTGQRPSVEIRASPSSAAFCGTIRPRRASLPGTCRRKSSASSCAACARTRRSGSSTWRTSK